MFLMTAVQFNSIVFLIMLSTHTIKYKYISEEDKKLSPLNFIKVIPELIMDNLSYRDSAVPYQFTSFPTVEQGKCAYSEFRIENINGKGSGLQILKPKAGLLIP